MLKEDPLKKTMMFYFNFQQVTAGINLQSIEGSKTYDQNCKMPIGDKNSSS